MARILLHETKYWFVVLAENQYYLGRSFIIFKGDAQSLSELSREEFLDLRLVIRDMESALKKAFGATYFNWTCLMNDAYEKDKSSIRTELHLHLWPRYKSEVLFEGKTFRDETFGDYANKENKKILSTKELESIRSSIKKHLISGV